jgi:hypothetical protein
MTFLIKTFDLETGFAEKKKQFELQTIWLKFEFPIYFPLYTRRRDEKPFHNKVGGNYKQQYTVRVQMLAPEQ